MTTDHRLPHKRRGYARSVSPPSGKCDFCRQPIVWARDPNGRWIPLDPEPGRGDWALLPEKRCLKPAVYGAKADVHLLHTDHRQTCGTTKAPAE